MPAVSLAEAPKKAHLLHPLADLLLLGGASLVFTLVTALLGLRSDWLSSHLGALLFVFSYPHFLASYPIFYGRAGPWRKHPFVAFVIPAALAGFLVFGVFAASDQWINFVAQATLLLIFWHFLKQAFGSSLWLAAVPGQPLSRGKRELLLFGLLFVGCYGYLTLQSGGDMIRIFGTDLQPLLVSPWIAEAARWAGYASILGFAAWLGYERYSGKNPGFAWQGWVPIAALLIWLEPAMGGSPTRIILPVFHAIQYLPFPLRVQLNEQRQSAGSLFIWARRVMVWGLLFALGVALFRWIPGAAIGRLYNPASVRVFVFVQLFLNLHHYFMDGVIWRFSDPEVRRRLIRAESALPGPQAAII